MNKKLNTTLVALGAALLSSTQSANAALLASDSFDYTDGSTVVGSNGGFGFTGA